MNHAPLRRAVLGATILALAVGALAAATPATAAPVPAPYYGIFGDVTGDGINDRVAFVDLSTPTRTRCYAWVRVGQPGGGLGSPVHVALPLPPGVTQDACPATGQVLSAPTPAGRRLAAVITGGLTELRAVRVYDLTGAAVANGAAYYETDIPTGVGDQYGSVDFDGDGYGDWWTDGETGVDLSRRHGSTWSDFYSSPSTTTSPSVQFFDLNRAGGKDVLVTGYSDGDGFFKAMVDAVDGKTGAVQRLATGDYDSLDNPNGVSEFRVGVVDLDHNGYPDIAVTPVHFDHTVDPTQFFLNKSQGGRWFFQRLSS